MARCKNCKQDKKHRNSTYFQTIKLPGKRELPEGSHRSKTNWKILDAFYYCHECIRTSLNARLEIRNRLNQTDVDHKIVHEIPEIRDLCRNDGDDGGDPLPA